MKTILKLLAITFFIASMMASCEGANDQPDTPDIDDTLTSDPNTFDKLHQYIRPTKPIKIPDTITIMKRPTIIDAPLDTIPQ